MISNVEVTQELPMKVDWSTLVAKFVGAVGNQRRVADLCGVGQSSISVISRSDSRKPNYETGAAIINAYLVHYSRVPTLKEIEK